MNKFILGIDGMACSMCEAHVQNAIRKNIKIESVKASRTKKNLIVITPVDLTEVDFHTILDPTGYRITSFKKDVAVKKLFRWK